MQCYHCREAIPPSAPRYPKRIGRDLVYSCQACKDFERAALKMIDGLREHYTEAMNYHARQASVVSAMMVVLLVALILVVLTIVV